MSDKPSVRFEIPLPAAQAAGLRRLSEQTGVRPRDLARLAITQLLANSDRLVAGQIQGA